MTAEKRRYFRISDTLGLAFRVVRPQSPNLKLSTDDMEDSEVVEMLDTELETLLNSLWSSDPKFARALGLINQKMEILLGRNRVSESEILEQFDHYFEAIDVNLSASGIAFTSEVKLEVNDRLELLILLRPGKTKLTVMGTVVNYEVATQDDRPAWFTCVNFDLEAQQEEQLIQHIVQRQVENISRRKESGS